jgi:hypothetical protein
LAALDRKTILESLIFDVEWEQKPSSPSSIRLISFGKLLDDKAPLKGGLQ